MSARFDQVKVLEKCWISPRPNSVPTTSFPLTFFDVSWITMRPGHTVFLYQVSFSATQFTEQVLPQLKNSLSLALQRFAPLCGNFVLPPQPLEPYILYKDGDSVPLLIASSNGAFGDFLKDEPKDAKEIHPLSPPTPAIYVSDDMQLMPLFAAQVTLFPNSGLSIGIKFRHVVADGTGCFQFIKTWASIFKANCDMSNVPISLPVLDKSVVKDPSNFKDAALEGWRAWGSKNWNKTDDLIMEDLVRATFTLSCTEINHLKKWVTTKCSNGNGTQTQATPSFHFSSYVVTCAFIWVCLIKSLDVIIPSSKDDELCHFLIAADCRNKYELGIPATFFGNAVSSKFVSVARSKFQQEDAIALIAKEFSQVIQTFEHGALDWYKHPSIKAKVFASGENVLAVAGSPKLAAYETDFGWGYPTKTEIVHIDISGSISLSESRKEKGGIEVGICRSRQHMEIFTSLFQAGLKQFLV